MCSAGTPSGFGWWVSAPVVPTLGRSSGKRWTPGRRPSRWPSRQPWTACGKPAPSWAAAGGNRSSLPGAPSEVRRLVLTASGGPFRGRDREQLVAVTPDQALAHRTWSMGPVVTVNSATLINKGLELIEAHLLFDVPVADIAVVVHPQSVVHSMVE